MPRRMPLAFLTLSLSLLATCAHEPPRPSSGMARLIIKCSFMCERSPTGELVDDGLPLGDWTVVHGDRPLPDTRVIHGHVHPSFRLGANLSAPCYLVAPRRLILPAFSADAAGVNVLTDADRADQRCLVCAGARVLDFGKVRQWQKAPRR